MIYCFDLDGTLCTDTNGDYQNAKPYTERIKKVNELYDKGHIIIIDTARGGTTGTNWRFITNLQLLNWGIKFHELRVGTKINANIYIDDKAINAKDFFKS